jgi:hypothetical protein
MKGQLGRLLLSPGMKPPARPMLMAGVQIIESMGTKNSNF